MNNLKIVCRNCEQELDHICNTEFAKEAKRLFSALPDVIPDVVLKDNDVSYREAAQFPIFSEAFLYPILGKEDARTVLALVGHLIRAAGLDPFKLERP